MQTEEIWVILGPNIELNTLIIYIISNEKGWCEYKFIFCKLKQTKNVFVFHDN